MKHVLKIAFGGGCHWCTEAVFQSLKGVEKVEQGFVGSDKENTSFSEAVVVHFDKKRISTKTLIQIHLLTHKSISDHSMREKYRSAIYTFSETQNRDTKVLLANFQEEFNYGLITKVLNFHEFMPSRESISNYYFNNPEKPFCQNFIDPKLKMLIQKFSKFVNHDKVDHLQVIAN